MGLVPVLVPQHGVPLGAGVKVVVVEGDVVGVDAAGLLVGVGAEGMVARVHKLLNLDVSERTYYILRFPTIHCFPNLIFAR